MPKFSTARGTRDFLPGEMAVRSHVDRVFRSTFERFGFQHIQTPMFEEFALLAARAGDEIRESMFTFISDRIEYALRPEMTAPVCRLVATEKLADIPLPYKLYYIGQCFQYRRIQPGVYREFRQAGVEFMGSSDPLSDAEVIASAVSVLKGLGITEYTLKVGNIGIFRDILAQGGLDFDAQSRVIGHIDRIQRVRERCADLVRKDTLEREDLEYIKSRVAYLFRVQDEICYEGECEVLPSRDYREDAAESWAEKLPDHTEQTIRALWSAQGLLAEEWQDRVLRIARLRGAVEEAGTEAAELVSGTAAEGALGNLREIFQWLNKYQSGPFEIVLGLTRGFDFYTGMVFEIDSPLLGAQKQICGGGRYDRLVREFGGPDLPATGFAFGFDRVVELFLKSGHDVDTAPVDATVAVPDAMAKERAVEIAVRLRARGLRVSLSLLPMDLQQQMDQAAGAGSRYVLVPGDESSCTLHDTIEGTGKVVSLKEAEEYLLQAVSASTMG